MYIYNYMYNILVYICYCVTYINKESNFNVCELGTNCIELVTTGVKCWMRWLEKDGIAVAIFDRDGMG